MLVLPNELLIAVGPFHIFVKIVVVGAFPNIVTHVHVEEMVGVEGVLIAEHHVCASCVASFTHIVDILRPLIWQIAEVGGGCAAPFVSEGADCAQINGVLFIGVEIGAQAKEHAVFMLLAVAVRIEEGAIVVAAARCRASGRMLGFKPDSSKRLEFAFVVVDIEIHVSRSPRVNIRLGISKIAVTMVFFQSDIDDAGSSRSAVLRRWVCHHLNALDALGWELTENLGAVVGVHAHLFAVNPHKHVGVATQRNLTVAVHIYRWHCGKKFISRCTSSGNV